VLSYFSSGSVSIGLPGGVSPEAAASETRPITDNALMTILIVSSCRAIAQWVAVLSVEWVTVSAVAWDEPLGLAQASSWASGLVLQSR
jgi:hypothetical protein